MTRSAKQFIAPFTWQKPEAGDTNRITRRIMRLTGLEQKFFIDEPSPQVA